MLRNFETIFKIYNPIHNINHDYVNHVKTHVKNTSLENANYVFVKYERSFSKNYLV